LVYPVARGGMARVWVAKLRGKHGFEKMVALKTILPTFAQDPRFRRMFLDEAKIASGIEHVNVAQILDLGEQSGQLYLVMEWVDGDSLQELERAAEKAGGALPIPVLVRVLADACAGLHAAHELADAQGKALNVVHRDVSPQNILISAKGVVKVIDFGVVKARRRATEETSTGTIKGKLQYMAPEQALGQAVDRRADIYSVGATLYRLLARRPVYRGNSPLSTYKRLTSSAPPEPLPAHVPGALSTIVLKALAFEPQRRFATAAELGAALEALLQGPYQTSAREVAACVELYLGPALAARRSAISEALEEQLSVETTEPSKPEWESGISEAHALPHSSPSAPPASAPRAAEHLERAAGFDDVTQPLHGVPPAPVRGASAPSGRARLVAAGGILALGGALVWGFGSGASKPARAVVSPASRNSTAPPPAPLLSVEQPVNVQELPMLSDAPAPRVHAGPAEPLANAAKPATPKHKPLAAPHPVAVPHPAPAVVAKPKRKVVDDGF
jgi:serine/threonine-protein kinase